VRNPEWQHAIRRGDKRAAALAFIGAVFVAYYLRRWSANRERKRERRFQRWYGV